MILLGHGHTEQGHEALSCDGLQRPPVLLHLAPGQGIERVHLAVQRIKPQMVTQRRIMDQSTAEQCDEFTLPPGGPSTVPSRCCLPRTSYGDLWLSARRGKFLSTRRGLGGGHGRWR